MDVAALIQAMLEAVDAERQAVRRALALPPGFVDVKACAVSPVRSALKLAVRKEPR